jgi:arginine repressor
MAAAAAIDSLQMNCVYGTIAGDDTIFVAVSDEIAGELIEEKLSAIIAGR